MIRQVVRAGRTNDGCEFGPFNRSEEELLIGDIKIFANPESQR
jgi:hypothetical protein